MDKLQQDLERYGVRTETRGYVCPGCEQIYPSVNWFHRHRVEDTVRCESCIGDEIGSGNYEGLLDTKSLEPWEVTGGLASLIVSSLLTHWFADWAWLLFVSTLVWVAWRRFHARRKKKAAQHRRIQPMDHQTRRDP
jgi:hypothetical protein